METIRKFKTDLGFHFSKFLNKPLINPHWIYISLTHKCNFNCRMCGVKHILKEYELDFDTLRKVFQEISGWDSDCAVVFTGGEPFLREDIFDIIDTSVCLGLVTEIVSNGSQINNMHIAKRIIRSGIENIAISLDGATPQVHDHIRGLEGAYQKATDALRHLSEAKKISKNSGPQISAWVTIMKENTAELQDIIYLSKELGVECLVYHPVIVTQDDMQNTIKCGDFWIQDKQINILKKQIDKIVEYRKQNGLVAFLHDPYLWVKYFQGALSKQDWQCNPFVFIDIGPDGSVRSCGPAFGNVKEMSLTDCLNTPEAQRARARMLRCNKPCLQTCWARPESDSLMNIVNNFISQLGNLKESQSHKKEIIKSGIVLLSQYEDLIVKKI